jgi:GNAT superfamily N-acetyltransferase
MLIEMSAASGPADRDAILAPLRVYNDQMTGWSGNSAILGVLLRDAQGKVEGGLFGKLGYDWFKLEFAFLPAHRRGGRLGARILSTLEQAAVARGARGVWMQSFSFQAPGFYQKLGYREIGILKDRPPGYSDSFLTKTENFACEGAEFVVTEDVSEEDRQSIRKALIAYSDDFAGPSNWAGLDLLVRDDSGAVIGGLHGRTGRGWLFIELLALPPALRGSGLGTKLMDMAEQEARKRGCIGVYLDTFSFQARPFYEKRGYRMFAEIPDYPTGHARYFLSRRLDQA